MTGAWVFKLVRTDGDAREQIERLREYKRREASIGFIVESDDRPWWVASYLGLEEDRDGSWRRESKWGGMTHELDAIIVAKGCGIAAVNELIDQCKVAGVPCYLESELST